MLGYSKKPSIIFYKKFVIFGVPVFYLLTPYSPETALFS